MITVPNVQTDQWINENTFKDTVWDKYCSVTEYYFLPTLCVTTIIKLVEVQ